MSESPNPAEHSKKTLAYRMLAFVCNTLAFALSLSIVITIVFFGLNIIVHGAHMCQVLAENNLLERILYTSCGCAMVEVVLLALSVIVLRFSAPKLWNDYKRFWSIRSFRR